MRSELTWEGTVPPPLKPHGECIVTTTPEGLHIDRADPRILISEELLDQLKQHPEHEPGVTLDGDLFRIVATNRTVIYRIGEKAPDMHAYYAEWPD